MDGVVLGVLVPVLSFKIPWCYLFLALDSSWVQAIEHAVQTLRERTGTGTVPASHLSWTVKWKQKCRHLNWFPIRKQLSPFLVTSWLPRCLGSKEKRAGKKASQIHQGKGQELYKNQCWQSKWEMVRSWWVAKHWARDLNALGKTTPVSLSWSASPSEGKLSSWDLFLILTASCLFYPIFLIFLCLWCRKSSLWNRILSQET